MDDDDPVHHVRVGEQRDSSPIQDEDQGEDNLHDVAQSLQNNERDYSFRAAKIGRISLAAKYPGKKQKNIPPPLCPFKEKLYFCLDEYKDNGL